MNISITKLKGLSSSGSGLKAYVDKNSPIVVTADSKPIANLTSVGIPPPIPTPTAPEGTVAPGGLLDLKNWYITLPTGKQGSPDTVNQPQLNSFSNPYFQLNVAKDGVIFTCPANGVHTANSSYPRSELREMNGTSKASWSNASGVHTLEGTYSITHTLVQRPQVVFAQCHDASSDLWEAAYDRGKLVVFWNNKKSSAVLGDYVQGTKFSFKAFGQRNGFYIYHNDVLKTVVPKTASGLYYKSGCYLQSSVDKWSEKPDAYAAVTVYNLKVSHG